jgi:hypothetical protein
MLHIIHDYSEYSTIQGIARIELLQWKPLNVIALYQCQSDNINQMITIADSMEYIDSDLGLYYMYHINQMIALSVITLCVSHCNLSMCHVM